MIDIYNGLIGNWKRIPVFFLLLILLLAACYTTPESESPTAVAVASQAAEVAEVAPTIAATWTTVPVAETPELEPTVPPPPTSTTVPTSTAVQVTDTPESTPTETVEPTATDLPPTETAVPAPTLEPAATMVPATQAPAEQVEPTAAPAEPTAAPSEPVEPALGVNLLPNPSFEEGHYNQDGIPELQLPNKWRVEWDETPTGVGNAAWDVYVRPEVRVLSTAFLPPEEHSLYIYNGQNTVKAFKGSGAVSFRLLTDVTLEPGTYVIEAKMFADIVEKWENREKQYAQDPTAAEFHFVVGDGGTVWTPQNFGQINVYNYTFTIAETKTIPVGIALRGKYAIANNGWFIDDLSLRRVE
ncbi:MAG: hypothetical protein ACK2UK_09375 [Candidatus Promineifilaceae bacterium]